MAVEEKVVIKVEVDADISNDLALIERRIKALEDRQRALNRSTGDLDRTNRRLDNSVGRVDNRMKRFNQTFGIFGRALKTVAGALKSFLMTFSKLSFIAVAAEVALFTAGLLAVKAALITGRLAVRGYEIALKGLSVVAASIATGLSVAAAALREFNEVQLAPLMGGGRAGIQGARSLSRGMTAQTRSLFGREALASVTSSFAGAGIRNGNALASQLLNISGGDAKAAQSLAALFAGAKRSGSTSQLIAGLQGAVGYNKGAISSGANLQSIIGTVTTGGATATAFQSVAQDMANTFIGTLKAEAEAFKVIFETIGEPLLAPFRDSFLQISRIIKDDLLGIAGALRIFGPESLAPSLVSFAEAVSEFVRSNIVSHMEQISGAADKFINFFKAIGGFFTGFGTWLKSYEDAANVVIDMLKAMFGRSAGGLFRDFANLLEDNRETFVGFGEAIGNVLNTIKRGFFEGNRGFFGSLPKLTATLNVIASSFLPNLYEVFGAIAPLFERFPEIIRDVSERLGPMLVNIFQAAKPLFDKIPEAVNGLLTVMTALEPVILLLIRAIDMLAGVLGAIPGGNILLGGGLLMAAGGGGGAFLRRGGIMGASINNAGRGARAAAGAVGGGVAAGGARAGMGVGARMSGMGSVVDDMILRGAYSSNPVTRGMSNYMLNNFRQSAAGSGLTGAYQRYLANGQAGNLVGLRQFAFNTQLYGGSTHRIPLPRGYGINVRIPQMTMPGARMNQFGLNMANRYNAFTARAPRFSMGNVTSKALGGLALYQTGRDLVQGGPGQLYNQAVENPLGAALQYGGAASLVGAGTLVGGATAAVGSVGNINRYGAGAGNVLTGLAGAALAGSTFGPAGAIAATLATAVAMGVAQWNRNKRIQKNTEEAGEYFAEKLTAAAKGGLDDMELGQVTRLSELGQSALDAGLTNQGFTEGDTQAMYKFVQEAMAMGFIEQQPLSEIHMDNFLQNELGPLMDRMNVEMEREFDRREREEKLRQERITANSTKLANSLNVAQEDVINFADNLGIALDGLMTNTQGFESLYNLYAAPVIDRMQAFSPDLSRTTAYGIEAAAGAQSALQNLINADVQGTYNVSDLSSFLDQYVAAEIAMGGSPDVAYLSGLLELQRQMGTGALSGTFGNMFNISDLISRNVGDLASSFGLDTGTLMSLVGTGEVEAVSQYIDQISTRREVARAGIFGGSQEDINKYISEYGDTLLSDTKFTRILTDTLKEEGFAVSGRRNMSGTDKLALAGESGVLDEALRTYLLDTGDATDQQITLLTDIKQAVGEIAPNISINGVPQGDRGGSFVYEIIVRTDNSGVYNGGGPNSGGNQYR